MVQNKDRIRYKNRVVKKYQPSLKTKIRIPLYAILKLTLEKILKRNAKRYLDYESLIFDKDERYKEA
jgi:deoxyadenosine/deoxycytidine kinase